MISKRKELSDTLLSLLFGACIYETVSISKLGPIGINDAFLIISTFLTALRFYIGNKVFISDLTFSETKLVIWIYDLLIIIIQSALFIALGALCTIKSNINVVHNFYQIYLSILTLDVLWILSQYILGRIFKSWNRKKIPAKWAVANSVYIVIIFLVFTLSNEPYGFSSLLTVFLVSVVAFILDVIGFDYAEIDIPDNNNTC